MCAMQPVTVALSLITGNPAQKDILMAEIGKSPSADDSGLSRSGLS